MSKTIQISSGHTIYISQTDREDLPSHLSKETDAYSKFYVVRNWDKDGVVFMYLGKGNKETPNEIVAWYRNTGSFWYGYGCNFKEAVEGAIKDGWLYA